MNRLRGSLAVLTLLVAPAVAATPAFGSAIIGADVSQPTPTIDRHGPRPLDGYGRNIYVDTFDSA